jgi:transposase
MDRWYQSSKTLQPLRVKLSLLHSERMYRCVTYGFACDRDENAARNLQVFPEAMSAKADLETRKTDRTSGTPGLKRPPDRQSASD